jgi:hypothetical protein
MAFNLEALTVSANFDFKTAQNIRINIGNNSFEKVNCYLQAVFERDKRVSCHPDEAREFKCN